MKMTELRHLQLVVLDILKDVDNVCRKNNIDYYLAYGSALGAVRHKGFIPWDDDIDIMLDNSNFEIFISSLRKELPKDKYFIQEGLKDWPMPYTKIRLRGTKYCERESYGQGDENGIFIDVFRLDNSPDNYILARWQYVCAKYYLAYALSKRSFRTASFKKKMMMYLTFPLRLSIVRYFIIGQSKKYGKDTDPYLACYYTRYRYHNSIIRRDYLGKPHYVEFENTKMPIPQRWHEYLSYIYGDYMTPPPESCRVGCHLKGIDFGIY